MFELSISNFFSGSAASDRTHPHNLNRNDVVHSQEGLFSSVAGSFLKYTTDARHKCSISHQIKSSATRVIFPTEYDDICLKLWISCDNDLYHVKEISARNEYLLEGLAFNSYFAPEVYLGITPILELDEKKISFGRIIEYPQMNQLERGQDYALVMRRLPESWRLDHQLYRLNSTEGMRFLATAISDIHKRLVPLEDVSEFPRHVKEKLALNIQQFEQALEKLAQEKWNIEPYKHIGEFMNRAYEVLMNRFMQRAEDGFVRRCHGDLKATNLWLKPPTPPFSYFRQSAPQLLALDCVDFNPKFCNIDTLSDVAMLAIDLEMRQSKFLWTNVAKGHGRICVQNFLAAYLKDMQEQNPWIVRPLLEYYMIEKAMVCAYMGVLYDGLPSLGKKYLPVALNHMLELETWFAYAPFEFSVAPFKSFAWNYISS